jgi:hypothetical protein
MPDQPQRPPRRPGSNPQIQGDYRELDRVMGGAPNQRRKDLPKRTATMPGMAALKAPPLFSPPETPIPVPRAPSQPPVAPRRGATPVASELPPTSVRVPADEPASSSLQSAQEAILRDELSRERAKVAQLERDARARGEARIQSFPPAVEQRHQSPPAGTRVETGSTPPTLGDWAKLRYKVATAIVAALVVVIGALAYWGVAAIDAKTEAIKAAQEAKKKSESREEQWRSWASVVIWIEDCRDNRDVRSGEMLLPDLNKQGTARKLEPWQNPCSPKLPPPP